MLLSVVLGRGILAFRQLVLVPFMLSAWGSEYYGAWLMISAIPSFLSMSDFGLGSAGKNKATLDFAAGDTGTAMKVIILSIAFIALVATVSTVATVALIDLFPIASINSIESPGIVAAFLVAAAFLQMKGSVFDSVWIGTGRASTAQNSINGLNALLLITIIVALLYESPAYVVAAITFSITLGWLLIYSIASTHTISSISNTQKEVKEWNTWQASKYLVWKGVGFQAGTLWQALYFQGSIVLAGNLLGPSGAALWGSLRIVVRSGNQFLELIGQTAAPELQAAFASGRIKVLHKIFWTTTGVSTIFGLFFSITLGLLGQIVFHWWTDNSFQIDNEVWYILCMSLIPFSIWWNGMVLHRCINKPWLSNLCGIFCASIAIVLLSQFGQNGIYYFATISLFFELMMLLTVIPISINTLANL